MTSFIRLAAGVASRYRGARPFTTFTRQRNMSLSQNAIVNSTANGVFSSPVDNRLPKSSTGFSWKQESTGSDGGRAGTLRGVQHIHGGVDSSALWQIWDDMQDLSSALPCPQPSDLPEQDPSLLPLTTASNNSSINLEPLDPAEPKVPECQGDQVDGQDDSANDREDNSETSIFRRTPTAIELQIMEQKRFEAQLNGLLNPDMPHSLPPRLAIQLAALRGFKGVSDGNSNRKNMPTYMQRLRSPIEL